MVKISVDEAYAFDYLSILELKKLNNPDLKNTVNLIHNDLIKEIGQELFEEILNSEEYKELSYYNKLTFDAVDKAKTDEVLASYVDKCNYGRMICKKKLQEKFFKTNLSEIKIGYEKLKV